LFPEGFYSLRRHSGDIRVIKMLKISELKGFKIKKDLRGRGVPVDRVAKEYHRKNRDGSGNFKFTIIAGIADNFDFSLEGNHDKQGNVTSLTLTPIGSEHLQESVNTDSYEAFINHLAKIFNSFAFPLL